MKNLNYSSITAMLRRIHRAKAISDETGVPVRELLDRDRELRRKLQREREAQRQRRDFLRAAGGLGLGAGLLAAPRALANPGGQPRIAIVGGGAPDANAIPVTSGFFGLGSSSISLLYL